jgi:hypothetical protein
LPEVYHLLDNNRCFTFISNLLNVARQLTGRQPFNYDAYEIARTVATQPDGGIGFYAGQRGGDGTRGGSNQDGQASIDVQLDSMGVDLGLSDPYPEPELWEPSEFSPIGLLPSSGMPSGRCTLDGIPVFCSDAEHLLQTGAAEFKRPDVVWDEGWRFVTFKRDNHKTMRKQPKRTPSLTV